LLIASTEEKATVSEKADVNPLTAQSNGRKSVPAIEVPRSTAKKGNVTVEYNRENNEAEDRDISASIEPFNPEIVPIIAPTKKENATIEKGFMCLSISNAPLCSNPMNTKHYTHSQIEILPKREVTPRRKK